MKVLNRIKSIYLLAIVALLSFCMLLFPAMPKTAGADGVMGTGEVEIKSARVIVQKYAQNTEKWALMFKAQVTLEQYNLITDNDTADVKFGMLIGPSARLEGLADNEYGTLTSAGYRKISYVGSVAGEDIQEIEFAESATTYDYWGSIVFDDSSLKEVGEEKVDKRIDAASMELTAIPYYYSVGGDEVVLMEGAKSAVPRNILVESYVLQTDNVVDEDSEPINKDTTVKNYAGEVEIFDGDAYICRSTNRLMVETQEQGKEGELVPADIVADGSTAQVVISAKPTSATGVEDKDDVIDAEFVAGLEKYGEANLVVYGEKVKIYKTQVAERVITRFADTDVSKITVAESAAVLPANYDGTADYLAKAGVTINSSGNISARAYDSIFTIKNGSKKFVCYKDADGAVKTSNTYMNGNVWYRSLNVGFDGLYVLAKNITIPTAHTYSVDTGSAYSNNGTAGATGADTDRAKVCMSGPIAYLGFNGVLDGRGFVVDVQGKATEGVLPNMFDAEIKNVAFLGLTMSNSGGGISYHARATKFTNVFAKVSSTSQYHADLNKGILMNVQDCTFTNFVADVNEITRTTVMTALSAYGNRTGSGVGQGVATSGVFSFRTYMDAYYDPAIDLIRYADASAAADKHFVENISIAEAKRLFPNIVHSNGKSMAEAWVATGYSAGYNPEVYGYVGYRWDPSLGTIFTGTNGTNVYAVGSSPLYVGYQYDSENNNGATLKATAKATVFVNEDKIPALKSEEETEYNWTYGVDGSGSTYTIPSKTYTMNEFVENDLFKFDAEDGVYSLGEIILRGKIWRHGETRMTALLGENNPEDVLTVRLVTMEGWYDVASYEDMAPYVLAQETPFDGDYWKVTDGIVTWAKLATQA